MIFILIVYKIESLSDYVRKQSIKFALYPKGRIQITYEIRWLLLEKFIHIRFMYILYAKPRCLI